MMRILEKPYLLSEFQPVNGIAEFPVELFNSVFSSLLEDRLRDLINPVFDFAKKEQSVVYIYNDIIPLSGTSGFLVVKDEMVIASLVIWRS
jgi:hypothetical protein